jgi:hypothetical protein
MSVSPAVTFPSSAAPQGDQGQVRAEQIQTFPPSGGSSVGESAQQQTTPTSKARGEDEVKLQWEPPGNTVVYRFVDQDGTLILQVPPQQILNLAQEISQELAPKPPAANEGGKE